MVQILGSRVCVKQITHSYVMHKSYGNYVVSTKVYRSHGEFHSTGILGLRSKFVYDPGCNIMENSGKYIELLAYLEDKDLIDWKIDAYTKFRMEIYNNGTFRINLSKGDECYARSSGHLNKMDEVVRTFREALSGSGKTHEVSNNNASLSKDEMLLSFPDNGSIPNGTMVSVNMDIETFRKIKKLML